MRNIFIILLFFLFKANFLFAQVNLVPNPSFEYYTSCPTSEAQIDRAYPWIDPTKASSDYYNQCAQWVTPEVPPSTGVPISTRGYEFAHTGVAYAGFYTFSVNLEGSEYIETVLSDSLIKDKKYCVSFYVSLADEFDYATNDIGAYFSTELIDEPFDPLNSPILLLYSPQIINPNTNLLTNKDGWTKVSGSFIASGGEKYITIGNFNYNANTDTVFVGGYGWGKGMSYYFIDDVSVYLCDTPAYNANANNDITICKGDKIQIGTHNYNEYIYTWEPNKWISDTSIGNPYVNPENTITYYLKVKDFKFTETSDSVTVTVMDCGNIFIPTAFTPNNDGQNDILYVRGGLINMEIKIFNQLGLKVFETNEQSRGWNGIYKGEKQPTANYVYIFKGTTTQGKEIIKNGVVSLIR